ncbi:Fic family protein [Roseicyclus mahoneyensis]|uniref:Fic/DOC family protein n=1 Tax=Roseicyclus mahoneyensis TaxID=164332 RepID=A0A316GNW7_9RHOB|nr:Fic family protein [Roseicyclus mahoneyensis]PWK62584.1 Fic/DOC family protein [Roseicyclus mahoneyensis]
MMRNYAPQAGAGHAMARLCNFQSAPDAGKALAGRCAEAQERLWAMPDDDRIALLADSRALHADLFAGLAPPDWPDAPGTWRGTPGSSIVAAPRAVFLARRLPGLRHRDLCLPPEAVPAAMAALAADLHSLWRDRPGLTDPWRAASFTAMAGATARFFAIHPYMDGNGHIWRLTLPALARRLGLGAHPGWTLHRRPYGPEFSLALQWYKDHPTILGDQLRRWFRPEP